MFTISLMLINDHMDYRHMTIEIQWRFSPILMNGRDCSMQYGVKTCDICGIVLRDKTAHFRVVFYCGQPKAHLCNNHAV